MEFSRNPPKNIEAPLEELLVDFYDAPTLRRFYLENHLPAVGGKPPAKAPKKAVCAEAILALSEDPEHVRRFVAGFPRPLREAMPVLLQIDNMRLNKIESLLGHPIVSEDPLERRRSFQCPLTLDPDFYPLVIWNEPRGYVPYDEHPVDRSNFKVSFPRSFREWLNPYFPKPPGYDFEGRAEPEDQWHRFNCAAHAVQDCVIAADFVRRGGIQRTKAGKISRPALKNLSRATSGGEPYPTEGEIEALPHFRHSFLTDFVEGLPGNLFAELAEAKIDPARYVRSVIGELAADADLVINRLLPHLRTRSHYAGESDADSGKLAEIIGIFGDIPTGKWVTREDLLIYCRYRNQTGRFFNFHTVEVVMEDLSKQANRYFYEPYRRSIDEDNVEGVITWPLLGGLAFALGALGLLEVAYSRPKNEIYQLRRHPFLSPYEGVQAVRLTDLGSYAFGKTEELDSPDLESNSLKLHFHPERLHLRAENLDAITEKTLHTYMEPIGAGLFKISRESFLKGCGSTLAVAEHIRQFNRSIPAERPPNWRKFFETLSNESAVLQKEPDWEIHRLPKNEAVRRAFAHDPVLRSLCRRVEGWRVAIPSNNIAKVEKHLRTLGFFPH